MKNTDTLLALMQKNMHALNMNGLHGRMLKIPPTGKKDRHILMLYGHHASLERIYGITEALSDFGTVTVPDLPGCGGMDSFYKIGMKPSLDMMADYLAAFIKLKYRGKKITIIGMSLGFVIATRMLQKYPELVKKVDLLISFVGFTHNYDMMFTPLRKFAYKNTSRLFSYRLPATFFYNVVLHPAVIRSLYSKTYNAKKKLESLSEQEKKRAVEFEVKLWRDDDLRTYMQMAVVMLTLDNCGIQVDLPVHHISVENDQYFDNIVVEQHMRVIFNDFTDHPAVVPSHSPSILATKKDATPYIPKSLAKLMRKKVVANG